MELRRYWDQIARGVEAALGGTCGPALAIYREASGGSVALFEDVVRANPAELPDLAGIFADTRRRAKREDAAETLRNVKRSGRSSTHLREILSAALDGRVLTLFVDLDAERGGGVRAVPRAGMPEDVPLAALFRY